MLLKNTVALFAIIFSLAVSLPAQTRLWILRAPGEMTEYDPATFDSRQTVKVPAEADKSPESLSVNHLGQMLFAPAVSLPFSDGDLAGAKKVWLWDGHTAATLVRDVARSTSTAGSNLVISESAPAPFLSADGAHLFWFSNLARRLQRDGVDLSTKNTWQAWQTDLTGAGRQEVASIALEDCRCPTGSCEESCPYEQVWVPDGGVGNFFLVTQFVEAKTQPIYKSSLIYEQTAGQWSTTTVNPPLHHVLDAANPRAILEAIPDTGCCGWANESNDQTLLRLGEDTLTVFDEQSTYKNVDYDVSFYTENGKLSSAVNSVGDTIVATAQPNKPIQLSEAGQANPDESLRVRKALLDLPAVEVKNVENPPRRIAYFTHATLIGWLSDKEILVVEGNLLVAYNVNTGVRRRSNIRVEDSAHAFIR